MKISFLTYALWQKIFLFLPFEFESLLEFTIKKQDFVFAKHHEYIVLTSRQQHDLILRCFLKYATA